MIIYRVAVYPTSCLGHYGEWGSSMGPHRVRVQEITLDNEGKGNDLKIGIDSPPLPSIVYRLENDVLYETYQSNESVIGRLEELPEPPSHYPFTSYVTRDKSKADFFAHALRCGFLAGERDREERFQESFAKLFEFPKRF